MLRVPGIQARIAVSPITSAFPSPKHRGIGGAEKSGGHSKWSRT